MLRNALCVQAALGSDRGDVVVHGVILSVTQWVEKYVKCALWRSLQKKCNFLTACAALTR